MVSNLLRGLIENHDAHPSFGSLADLQVQFNHVAAVIVFFSWSRWASELRRPHRIRPTGRIKPVDLITKVLLCALCFFLSALQVHQRE